MVSQTAATITAGRSMSTACSRCSLFDAVARLLPVVKCIYFTDENAVETYKEGGRGEQGYVGAQK